MLPFNFKLEMFDGCERALKCLLLNCINFYIQPVINNGGLSVLRFSLYGKLVSVWM